MRPPRRQRTGARRDDGVRTIRTNEVRYPGTDLPPLPEDMQERYRAQTEGEPRIGPARDTGIAVEGRLARQERSRRRNGQRMTIAMVAAAAGLLLLAIGWQAASDKHASGAPLGGDAAASVASAAGSSSLLAAAAQPAPKVAPAPSRPATATLTPYFASYKGLKLRLPIRLGSLTEIGFHQASYSYALSMKTPLGDTRLSAAGNHYGTHRQKMQQSPSANAWLIGKVLRMWRARPGRPDTAADVGAKPGTSIFAPVTGTVIKVKAYKLYGRWDDFEIHISPDGYPNLDVVMIHTTGIAVVPGERVEAGVTRLAAVRKLSDKFYDQLASYTKDGGNHVHLQVNNALDPKYKGLDGAVAPVLASRAPVTAIQIAR